jgi:hypothetical protein
VSYHAPIDPRPQWEWCPLCSAWYEIRPNMWLRAPLPVVGTCTHFDDERRLSEDEVNCASRSAEQITAAFRVGQIGPHP